MNDALPRFFRPDLENPQPNDLGEVVMGLNALPLPWVEPIDISNAVPAAGVGRGPAMSPG